MAAPYLSTSIKSDRTYQTRTEEFHFSKARTLDIRQTIIGAITALELALNEKVSGTRPSITINEAMREGVERDPWMQYANSGELGAIFDANSLVPDSLSGGEDYGTYLSGTPNDPLLVDKYSRFITTNTQDILTQAVKQNCKIVVRGDEMASEITPMLTSINGSSMVVDRAIIEPGVSETTLQENNPPRNALVVSAYTLDKGKVRIGLERNGTMQSQEITVGTNPTREVAIYALSALEMILQPQQEHIR